MWLQQPRRHAASTFGCGPLGPARRTVGSIVTPPFAKRNVRDEIWLSPTARRLKMNRQPFFGAPDWSGCRTMLGLNKADASNEYSLRKYAPIRRRCVVL